MGLSNLVPKGVQVVVSAVIYCSIAVLALTMLSLLGWMLLGIAGVRATAQPPDPRSLLIVFGIGVAVICATLWLATVVDIVKIPASVEKRIWQSLIAAILATTAGAVSLSLKPREAASPPAEAAVDR
jgi:hypothetical protein